MKKGRRAPFPVASSFRCGLALRPKALAGTVDTDEGLNHLGVDEVAVEFVQFLEPEVEARWSHRDAGQPKYSQHEGVLRTRAFKNAVLGHLRRTVARVSVAASRPQQVSCGRRPSPGNCLGLAAAKLCGVE